MRQINQTMYFYLSNSFITLGAIVILSAVLFFVEMILPLQSISTERATTLLVLINVVISCFVGVYLGGGLLKLRQYYLWTINSHFRHTLIGGFLLLIGIASLLQSLVMSVRLQSTWLLLLAPFCVAIFSAYAVLGKTYLHKIIIPGSLLLAVQAVRIGLGNEQIMLFVLLATVTLIFYLYRADRQPTKPSNSVLAEAGFSTHYTLTPIVARINHFIGRFIFQLLSVSRRDIGWAISLPYFKLALIPLVNLLVIVIIALFVGLDGRLVEGFTLMVMASNLVSIVMESRRLIPQTKSIAHLFRGENHKQLKTRMLRSLDFTMSLNCVVLYCALCGVSLLFSFDIAPQKLLLQSLVVLIVAQSIYPVMLSLQWLKISVPQILILLVYIAMIIGANMWLGLHFAESWVRFEVVAFLAMMMLLRITARRWFIGYSLEKLLVIK